VASASEKAPLDPIQGGRTGGLVVFAEKETKSHRAQINAMLKGSVLTETGCAVLCGNSLKFASADSRDICSR
jgi:hypothetical protein